MDIKHLLKDSPLAAADLPARLPVVAGHLSAASQELAKIQLANIPPGAQPLLQPMLSLMNSFTALLSGAGVTTLDMSSGAFAAVVKRVTEEVATLHELVNESKASPFNSADLETVLAATTTFEALLVQIDAERQQLGTMWDDLSELEQKVNPTPVTVSPAVPEKSVPETLAPTIQEVPLDHNVGPRTVKDLFRELQVLQNGVVTLKKRQ